MNIDTRIRGFKQKHEGIWNLKNTYNRALDLAEGQLIAILEGDDYWFPDTLNILVNEITTLPDSYGMVYGKAITVGRLHAEKVGRNFLKLQDYRFPWSFSHQIYAPIASIPPQSCLIKKEVLIEIGGFHQPASLPLVDRPTFLELSLRYRIHHVNFVLSYWRQHGTNVTSIYALEMAVGAIPWMQSFFEQYKKLEGLQISCPQATRMHEMRAFHLAISMISEQLKTKGKRVRIQSLRNIVVCIRRMSMKHKLLIWLNVICVSLSIDIRPVFYFTKGFIDYFYTFRTAIPYYRAPKD
jgi:hypothetical protein